MSQNDDQNPDRQDSEGYQDQSSDESTREARTDVTPLDSEQNQGTQPQDEGTELEEADDSDEDRDEDDRVDGGPDRRNNIG